MALWHGLWNGRTWLVRDEKRNQGTPDSWFSILAALWNFLSFQSDCNVQHCNVRTPLLGCVLTCSVMSDSLQLDGLSPTRFLSPWNSPGEEYWSGWPFPFLRDLPDPGSQPMSVLADGFVTTEPSFLGQGTNRCDQREHGAFEELKSWEAGGQRNREEKWADPEPCGSSENREVGLGRCEDGTGKWNDPVYS